MTYGPIFKIAIFGVIKCVVAVKSVFQIFDVGGGGVRY